MKSKILRELSRRTPRYIKNYAKRVKEHPIPHAAAGATVGLTGVGLYDAVKAIIYPGMGDMPKVLRSDAISEDELNKLISEHEKKYKRTVTPLRTAREVKKSVLEDLVIPGKGRKLNKLEKVMVGRDIKETLKHKINALAMKGEKSDYVAFPKKVNRYIAAHEIGHLKDFATVKRKDPNILSSIFKKHYKNRVLDREEAAWSYVKEDEKSKELKRKAIGSYHQAFHVGRSAGAIGLAGLIASLIHRKYPSGLP